MDSSEVGDAPKHSPFPVNADATSAPSQPSSIVPLSSGEILSNSVEAYTVGNTTSIENSAVQPPFRLTEEKQNDTSKSLEAESFAQPESGQSRSSTNEIETSTSDEVQASANAGASTAGEAPTSSSQHVPYVSYPDIEVDSNPRAHDSDADSAIGSMPGSSTVSLRESVFSYVEENGRTYHAFHAGKYIGPNDEEEQERLDLQHHLFVMTMNNKLHLAPITNPQNVLDIATGTGIWAIEFAQEYPSASVLGTDLSPIQPL
ncbi:uncharacterized protein PAC_12864 [Phialocephala subalpina]|uniref:Methyltransferase domain-containing protein n=1 Tax=Phialocephala subalpina TaxID=576137 RepID=A0A1L7XDC7_9HELO|nr:uncharacterized protein PAC_12864 [Phialocephala subalpina]